MVEDDTDLDELAGAPDDEPLGDEEYQGILKAAISDAIDYVDTHLAPSRQEAMKLYRGEPLGNEEAGRSQIVMTELRDVVQAMLPSLLRVFCSTERYVEFLPAQPEDAPLAEQMTDYIQHILMVENNGFSVFHDAMKDALISKTGVIRWRVEEKTEVTENQYSGLDEEGFALLISEEGAQVVSFQTEPDAGEDAMPSISATIRRTTERKRFVVEAIPPEEFLIDRNARDVASSLYVGHRQILTVSDLVEMGYDFDEVVEHAGSEDGFINNTETQTRVPAIVDMMRGQENSDPSSQRVYYVENFIRVDKDNDGIAELRRVCTIGGSCYVLHDEVVTEAPFTLLTPDPLPHAAIGFGISDQVRDLQMIKTSIVRSVLDSLAMSIHPRVVGVEGQVNFDDLLNNENGAVIRAKQPGMVQSLDTPFVGIQAMPVLEYMDAIRAGRTGMTKASQGLDPDVLQSTTKAAVTATMAASEQRLEMIARIFAETGMKALFRGLLRAVVKNQDKPRTVRLRNSWVAVDPRSWTAEMDVIVNVGLGHGNATERTQLLLGLAQKQEQALISMGPDNPLCSLVEYRNTLAKILELANIRDASRYLKPVTTDSLAQLKPPAQQQDPSAAILQAQIANDKAKNDLEMWKARAADDRERDRVEADVMLRAAEMSLKYGAQVDTATIRAMMDRNRQDAMQQQAQPMPMPMPGGLQ